MKTFGEGRYEVVEELASSRLGHVYTVRATATGTRFALKTFSPKLGASELERFRREAMAMAALEHPNIVRCFDFGTEPDGTAFLVMDLADGRTLERILGDEGPVEAIRAAKLGAQIAAALGAAHAHGIVHRDVQPSNAMIVPGYDGGEMAKLIDFGVASIRATDEYQRLTRAGDLLGNPAYSAPELLRGEDATPVADVYGLGATLYGLLAGEPPYARKTVAGAIRAALKGAHTPLLERRPEIGELATIVERAMALAPRDRYPTVGELESELRRVAQGKSQARAEPARSASSPRTASRSIFTIWVALTTVLSIGAAIAIVVAAHTTGPNDATIEPPPIAPVRPTLVEVGDAGFDGGSDAGFDGGLERVLTPTAMLDPPARTPDAGPPATQRYRVRFGGTTPRIDTGGAPAVARIGSALEACVRPLPVGSRVWVDVTTIHRCVQTARAGGAGVTSVHAVCFDRAIASSIPACGLAFQWVPEPATFRMHYVVESD